MKILIIGGAGFIGLNTANALLKHGLTVEIADTPERLKAVQASMNGITTKTLNFPEISKIEKLLKGVDGIIHLSWTTIPSTSMDSLVYDAQSNIISSIEIFRAAANCGVKRIVFSSSGGTVYGIPKALPVTENSHTNPISSYGISKLTVEHYLALFNEVMGISLRIGNPYGAYQLRGTSIGIIAKALTSIKEGKTIDIWGDGTVIRDFLNVEAVANAFTLSMVTETMQKGSYNIGTGIGHSINDILKAAFDVTGKKVPVVYHKTRNFDVPSIILDSSKFSKATEWNPNPKDLLTDLALLWNKLNQ